MSLDDCLVDDIWLLSLKWQSSHQLRNRYLRLWSLWHPWKPSFNIAIPDEAVNTFDTEVPRLCLSPGLYRVEITLVDPWSSQESHRPAEQAPDSMDVVLGTAEEIYFYLQCLPYDILGCLERVLSAQDKQSCSHILHSIAAQFDAQYIQPTFETLLVVDERMSSLKIEDEHKVFSLCQRLLLQYPIDLLALAGRYSLPYGYKERRRFEELLWKLSPNLGRLLSQAHQNAALMPDELAYIVPSITENEQKRAEVFSILRDAGIYVKETSEQVKEVEPSAFMTELPSKLFSDHILDSLRLICKKSLNILF